METFSRNRTWIPLRVTPVPGIEPGCLCRPAFPGPCNTFMRHRHNKDYKSGFIKVIMSEGKLDDIADENDEEAKELLRHFHTIETFRHVTLAAYNNLLYYFSRWAYTISNLPGVR